MNQDQTSGMIRHVLTTIGGILVSKGYTDESTMLAVVGGLIAVGGFLWSFISKNK